MNALSFLI